MQSILETDVDFCLFMPGFNVVIEIILALFFKTCCRFFFPITTAESRENMLINKRLQYLGICPLFDYVEHRATFVDFVFFCVIIWI